jgi:hypothetical protein
MSDNYDPDRYRDHRTTWIRLRAPEIWEYLDGDDLAHVLGTVRDSTALSGWSLSGS